MKQKQKKFEGNVMNCLMASNESIPVVGEFVTELQYLDRVVHIVEKVEKNSAVIIYCENKFIGKQMGDQEWRILPTKFKFTVKYRYGAWYKIVETTGKPIYTKIRLLFGESKPYRCWEF
jgi:hypothetical protein